MTIAERLKAARKAKQLTQAGLAAKSGVVQQTIAKLETGKFKATRHLVELAAALDVSPEWLATGQERKNEESQSGRPISSEPVHEHMSTRSRFRRLDADMLRKAELYAITAEATEGVTYAPVVFNRYLLDAYEILEANHGDFPAEAHDRWVLDALRRQEQRGTADGRDSRHPPRKTASDKSRG